MDYSTDKKFTFLQQEQKIMRETRNLGRTSNMKHDDSSEMMFMLECPRVLIYFCYYITFLPLVVVTKPV